MKKGRGLLSMRLPSLVRLVQEINIIYRGFVFNTLPHVFEIIRFSSFFAFVKNVLFKNGGGYPLQR